jgi:hypothetical protein
LGEITNLFLLFIGEACFEVLVVLGLLGGWLHDQFLTKAFYLRFQFSHLIQVWAVFLSMLVEDYLLVILLLLAVFT